MAKAMRYRTKNETAPNWNCERLSMDENGEADLKPPTSAALSRQNPCAPSHKIHISIIGECQGCWRQRMTLIRDDKCVDCLRKSADATST